MITHDYLNWNIRDSQLIAEQTEANFETHLLSASKSIADTIISEIFTQFRNVLETQKCDNNPLRNHYAYTFKSSACFQNNKNLFDGYIDIASFLENNHAKFKFANLPQDQIVAQVEKVGSSVKKLLDDILLTFQAKEGNEALNFSVTWLGKDINNSLNNAFFTNMNPYEFCIQIVLQKNVLFKF